MAYDLNLTQRVRTILQDQGEVSECKMFGCLAFMIGGNMCCGVMKAGLFLKLSAEAAVAARQRPWVRSMDPTGKRMKSMVVVESAGLASDEALREWVDAAVAIARARPPKQRTARKPGTKRRPAP
jgi:TfoX/Sxy family transcriptional regulator of competence genes